MSHESSILGETEFAKELGLVEAVSIAVGAMIGGGIFTVLGKLANIAGPSAMVSFLMGGIIVFLTAISYYKLVAKYPSAGGEFVILRKGFENKSIGNVVGVMLWLGYSVTIALYAFTFGLYTSELIFQLTNIHFFELGFSGLIIGGFNTHITGRKVFAFISIFTFMLINLRGVKETGVVQNVIVLFKLFVLFFIAAVGISVFNPSAYTPFFKDVNPLHPTSGENFGLFGGIGSMIMGGAIIFVSYEGFQVIANTVEELKNPTRDVKLGMIISVILVTITYVLVTLATFSLLDPHKTKINEAALLQAVEFLGYWAVILVAAGAAASTTSAINATLLGSSRLAYVLADYKSFPTSLAKLSKKSKVPYLAIIATSLFSWIFTFFGNAEEIAEVGSVIFLGIFFIVNVAAVKLYPKEKNYLAKAGAILILINLILVFVFIGANIAHSQVTLITLTIFLTVSFGLNYYYNRKSKETDEDHLKKYDLEPLGKELIQEFSGTDITVDEYFVELNRMLVAISGDQFETKNWEISALIAKKYNVEVDIIHVGPERDLEDAFKFFRDYGVKYNLIRVDSGDIAETIIQTINNGEYQLVTLASKRKKSLIDRLSAGSVSKEIVDTISTPILQVHPPEYGVKRKDINDLFVLLDGSERDFYLARWAKLISSVGEESKIFAYHIIEIPQTISLEDAANFDELIRSKERFEEYSRDIFNRLGMNVIPVLLYGHNFVKALKQATVAREPDAVLIGHTKDKGLWNRIRTNLAYRIMKNIDSAVIVHHQPLKKMKND